MERDYNSSALHAVELKRVKYVALTLDAPLHGKLKQHRKHKQKLEKSLPLDIL